MNIGERIKELRTKKGITVNKLANLSGVSQSYLRDIELGNKQPTVEYLSYICQGLGISLVAFFDIQDSDNDLNRVIAKLSDNQKESLLEFLKTITD